MHKHWIREFSDSPKPAPLYDMYYGNDYSEPVIVCLEREDGTRYIPPKLWAYSKVHELFVLFRELFEFRVPDTIQFQT